MNNRLVTVSLFCAVLSLGGCAFDVVHVEQQPTQLQADKACSDFFVLARDVTVPIGAGYERKLRQDTRWHCVGNLAQGKVFKSKDQLLTIEASNVFEANIVVASGHLVGFYLPVERAFSPLGKQMKLAMRDSKLLQTTNQ